MHFACVSHTFFSEAFCCLANLHVEWNEDHFMIQKKQNNGRLFLIFFSDLVSGYFGLWTICKDLPQGRSFCGLNVTAFNLSSMSSAENSSQVKWFTYLLLLLLITYVCSMDIYCRSRCCCQCHRDRFGCSAGRLSPVDAQNPRASLSALSTGRRGPPRSLCTSR